MILKAWSFDLFSINYHFHCSICRGWSSDYYIDWGVFNLHERKHVIMGALLGVRVMARTMEGASEE